MTHQEDTLWTYWIDFYKAKTVYTSYPVYAYRTRMSSLMHARTEKNRLQYFNSLHIMLRAYRTTLEERGETLSAEDKKHLEHRIYWSVQNILLSAMRLKGCDPKKMLATLTAEGFYPYPVLWERLSWRYGYKILLVDLLTLPFPFKLYYLAACKIYGFIYRHVKN